MNNKKVAILYIATGPYINFFSDFHLSSERFFLRELDKKYFLFSDIPLEMDDENVVSNKIDKSPWPLNTLLRFEYFNSIIDSLRDFDYIFFFNANALFVSEFTSDLLPNENNSGLIGVEHPGFVKKIALRKPFERRRNITCRLNIFHNGIYAQGCFNGGTAESFLKLIEMCSDATRKDLKNNLIARVHDESYLNWYFSKFNPKILSPCYSWPEVYGENSQAVIVMRDKEPLEWYKNFKK